jgi:four helix bundle protein
MHNIAEGFDSGTDAEFRRFLRISQRSVLEVQSQLYTALDQKYIDQQRFEKLYEEADVVKAHIRKFANYLSVSRQIKEVPTDYQTDVGRWTLDENEDYSIS